MSNEDKLGIGAGIAICLLAALLFINLIIWGFGL